MVISEAHAKLGNSSSSRADLRVLHAVQDVQEIMHVTTRALICDIESRDNESRDTAWSNALKQASAWAGKVRAHANEADSQHSIFIMLSLETHLRFYEMLPDTEEAIDWAPAQGRLFELADDEAEVAELWRQMRELILTRQT